MVPLLVTGSRFWWSISLHPQSEIATKSHVLNQLRLESHRVRKKSALLDLLLLYDYL